MTEPEIKYLGDMQRVEVRDGDLFVFKPSMPLTRPSANAIGTCCMTEKFARRSLTNTSSGLAFLLTPITWRKERSAFWEDTTFAALKQHIPTRPPVCAL